MARRNRNMEQLDNQQLRQKLSIYEHELPGGWKILAGKNDADNDQLSLRIAKANDYWFHVRSMPGSHVILIHEGGEEAGKEQLEAAAAVAAYYSKARDGGVVPVSCTQAKNVSKPKGAKAGTVSIRKEKVLKVRPGLPD